MTARLRVAYSDDMLRWQLGAGHPTDPMRAARAVALLRPVLGDAVAVGGPRMRSYAWRGRIAASGLHTDAYLRRLLDEGRCDEWEGARPDLAETALLMCASTLWLSTWAQQDAADGEPPRVGFNPQGAKHHALSDVSAGFCALNDMAIVAHEWSQRGKRVLYVDWDVHRGDGVEALTWDDERVMTASVHGQGLFAGEGRHQAEHSVFNWALRRGSGDTSLLASVMHALAIAELGHSPDVVLVAAGADGLANDPLGNLSYTIEGLAQAGELVGKWAGNRRLPVIVGGAGGYLPERETPVAWAATVAAMHRAHSAALESR